MFSDKKLLLLLLLLLFFEFRNNILFLACGSLWDFGCIEHLHFCGTLKYISANVSRPP